MIVLITLTTAGADVGPFDLFSNTDGYSVAFETGVSRSALVAGYTSSLVPNGTTVVRVYSNGVCVNYIDLTITTTTTTTTEPPIVVSNIFALPGVSDSATACSLNSWSSTIQLYANGPFTIGRRLYENNSLTLAFDGNNLWYKDAIYTDTVYSVDSSGYITDVITCV